MTAIIQDSNGHVATPNPRPAPFPMLEDLKVTRIWEDYQKDPYTSQFTQSGETTQKSIEKTDIYVRNYLITGPVLNQTIVDIFLRTISKISSGWIDNTLNLFTRNPRISLFMPNNSSLPAKEKIQVTCQTISRSTESSFLINYVARILMRDLTVGAISRVRIETDAIKIVKRLSEVVDGMTPEQRSMNLQDLLENKKAELLTAKNLNFSELFIKSFPIELFPYLENVETIDLSGNDLRGVSSQFFINLFRLPKLTHVTLSHNFFSLDDLKKIESYAKGKELTITA